MAKNPSQSTVSSSRSASGMVAQDSLNNPISYNGQGYNTFDRSRIRNFGQRFADAMPFDCVAALEANVERLRCNHELRTYTLKSPLLTPVKMHRSFFQVPWSSIMPNTWELLYKQPVKGDDIIFSNVDSQLPLSVLGSIIPNYTVLAAPSSVSGLNAFRLSFNRELTYILRTLVYFPLIWSQNSAIKNLKLSLPYDYVGDQLQSAIVDFFSGLAESYPGEGYLFRLGYIDSDEVKRNLIISNSSPFDLSLFMDFIDRCRFYPDYLSVSVDSDITSVTLAEDVSSWFNTFVNSFNSIVVGMRAYYASLPVELTIDIKPLIAYQQIIYQYYTNSHIDDTYSGKMYNQNMYGLARRIYNNFNGSSLSTSFEHNGNFYEYDAFSGFVLRFVFNSISGFLSNSLGIESSSNENGVSFSMSWLVGLFGIGRSLKYGDYFTSGRTQPLAVGDVTYTVNEGKVSVIDNTKARWYQAFLNAANRAYQNIEDYMYSLAGIRPARVQPQPNFLCSEEYNVGGMEVENTGNNQGNVVTLLRSTESRYMYEILVDEPSYIIGINSFSASLTYPDSTDRFWFYNDRLDWFQNFMQHIGDQHISARELTNRLVASGMTEDHAISYVTRYWDFKTCISTSTGPFIDGTLPSWILLADTPRPSNNTVMPSDLKIDEDFIRNNNKSFDELYASLTGTTLSNRVHFIISTYISNEINSRQEKFPNLI